MADLGEFSVEGQGEMRNFEPIPPDKYEIIITDSEMNPTQAGDLNQLKLTWQVTSGEHAGRYIWSRVNLPNANHPVATLPDNKRKAIEIGGAELATICRALGKPRIADSAELHGIPCIGTVRIEIDKKGQYGPKNVIKGYAPLGDLVGAGAPTSAPSARTSAPAATKAPTAPVKSPPWVKK